MEEVEETEEMEETVVMEEAVESCVQSSTKMFAHKVQRTNAAPAMNPSVQTRKSQPMMKNVKLKLEH